MSRLAPLLLLLACDRATRRPAPTHANAAPTIASVTLSPSAPTTDEAVAVAVVAGDPDGDPVTLRRAWSIDGVDVGFVGESLDPRLYDRGQTLRVDVWASDGATETGPVSATAVVADTAPGAPTLAIEETDEGDAGAGLRCVVTADATDLDGDALAYAATWTVDGTPFSDTVATAFPGDTVRAEDAARGRAWTCSVVANDGELDGPAATATHTLAGPAPSQYAFEQVMAIPHAVDVRSVGDGTLLVATILGEIVQVDPAAAAILGTAAPMDWTDELLTFVLDPRFGDGTHDVLYAWGSKSCDLVRYRVTLDPFTLSEATTVFEANCVDDYSGHCGGGLAFWEGETGEPALYVGTGPITDGDAQSDDNLGKKLLAFAIDPDTGEATGAATTAWADDRIAAFGLRNPWRIVDCGAALCIADPGLGDVEEIELYTGAGMNFGHPIEEGPGSGLYDDPAIWWNDDDPTYMDADLDGGALPGFVNVPWVGLRASDRGYGGRLDGWLLYGEFYDGWVRAARVDDTGALTGDDVPVAHQQYVMGVAETPDGTIWAVELGGSLRKLVLRADRRRAGEPGDALSASDYASGTAYDVRYPLWSNGADKDRVLVLPPGETVDTTNPDAWAYPVGTRLYKTFAAEGVNVETRVIERQADGWAAGVYLWERDDAYVSDGYRAEVTLPSGATYRVPSTATCEECHASDRAREWPLGLEPFQLGDQGLGTLAAAFDAPPGPAPDVESEDPTTVAVRGWLHGNCAYCHNPAGIVFQMSVVDLDFRYDAAMDWDQHTAQYFNANPNTDDGRPIVDVARPSNSVLVTLLQEPLMPPVATWEPDAETIGTILTWIDEMEP